MLDVVALLCTLVPAWADSCMQYNDNVDAPYWYVPRPVDANLPPSGAKECLQSKHARGSKCLLRSVVLTHFAFSPSATGTRSPNAGIALVLKVRCAFKAARRHPPPHEMPLAADRVAVASSSKE